jgi:ArsR family transcriptional regulator, arsenate/arsenite/antimonite-responsive transcriptional repressor
VARTTPAFPGSCATDVTAAGGTLALAGPSYRKTKTLWVTGLAERLPPTPLTAGGRQRLNQYVLNSVMTDELRALADPLRARIVELLAGEQLCTCHLAELTGARQTNISNHLRVLREAGVIEAQPAGRYTYYRVRPEALAALAAHYSALADRARGAAQPRKPCV